MSFTKDMERFIKKAEKAVLMTYRGTALEVFGSVIRRTPVDTGRLRANWQVDLNRPAIGEVNGTPQQAVNKGRSEIGRAKASDSIYITNNLPYAQVIEEGSSKQAPQGMVGITVRMYRRIVAAQARKNK